MKRYPSNNLVTTQKRLLALFVLATFLFCLLGVRLAYLQVVSGEQLQARAVDQWTRDLPLKALRGEILDRKGRVLATSHTTYTVYVRPRAVKDRAGVCGVLAAELGIDYDRLYDKLGQSVSEITVAKNVTKDAVTRIRACAPEGVLFGESSARTYPLGSGLSRVLGFTNVDSVGATGLESYYESYLKGVDGVALTQTDLVGIETGEPAIYLPSIDGLALRTTLDVRIQEVCEQVVSAAMERFSPRAASCLVMDVRDGGIVAQATAPAFDLNDPPRDDIDALNALSKNILITDVYEPGSTFKIFTTAAALEEGLTHENDTFYCPGYRIVDGQRIRCWRTTGHGQQTLAEGVQNSCNCVFMDLALRLGTERLYRYLRRFGFGAQTGIDFPGESKGIMMAQSKVKTVDLARIGFGQAVAVTPVQVLAGVSMAVNGGHPVTPHFATAAEGKSHTVSLAPATEREQVISTQTAELLCKMLSLVVSKGGGKNASVPGYLIGGKTGTAQKYSGNAIAQGKYVSSFVGFAPADAPRYAVMVLVDEPQGWMYYGSQVAAPYAASIFRAIFDYEEIAPTQPVEEPVTVEMPDLIGLSLTRAAARLATLEIHYEVSGEGGSVVEQVPAPGAQIAVGGCAVVRMSE